MGCGASQEEILTQLKRVEDTHKEEWEAEKRALAELDARTRVGHLLIELRILGFVEIQGKDIGGIYERLDEWLKNTWGAKKTTQDLQDMAVEDCCGYGVGRQVGALLEHDQLCDASYTLGTMNAEGIPTGSAVYKARGREGENNMGKLTMKLVDFMTNTCGWTLQVADGGNNGYVGQIREQQIKFKAPHPLNLIAPHVMIELRAVGYIEINGPNADGIYGKLHKFLTSSSMLASACDADPDYCDAKYSCISFKKRGSEGENNMGMMTMRVVDFMVKQCAWTMVTCNGGNFGVKGDKREQQLVFRNDAHVQHGENHILIELRTSGYIEINGLHDSGDFADAIANFCMNKWGCTIYKPYFWEGDEKYCDVKYTCPPGFYYREKLTNNLGKLTIQFANFAGQHGWSLLLANGGSITPSPHNQPNHIIREQQLKFTKCKNPEEAKRPLLMIELRTQPRGWNPPSFDGYVEINGTNVNGIYEKLETFICKYMGGRKGAGHPAYCDVLYWTGIFRLKEHRVGWDRWDGLLNGESNIGKWTMRLCDYMVDHIGEWDMIACNSDNVDWNFRINKDHTVGVTGREMQLIFRHRPGGRAVFMSASKVHALGRPPLQAPKYWKESCRAGKVGHEILPGTAEEMRMIQELLDKTFKAKATRDRREQLAERFVVVSCLRSEHPALWDKFAKYRKSVQEKSRDQSEFVFPKTTAASHGLADRCSYRGTNPTCQAFLLHGTSPTSAVSILDTSFKVDLAGKTAGTMFGPGVYLAESSSKADEYASDDKTGEYEGLFAVLVCRAVCGRPFITEQPGNWATKVTTGEYDVVLGDREKAVGTFREFVFFDEGAIYPEFAVFYRREGVAQAAKAPKQHAMVAPPAGGQWSFEGEGKWHPFDADVSAKLSAAKAAGASSVEFKGHGGMAYKVDLDRMIQVNLGTGKERAVKEL